MAAQPRAFISYARKDGEAFATALRRRLRAMDPEITLWQDRAELEGGIGWWKQIEAALDQVRFLIIVMTPEAIASPNTQDEWRHARRKGVIVYPVKGAPDRELDYAALPSWIRKAHFYDIGTPANEQWQNDKEWEAFVTHLRSDRQPVRVPFMAPDVPSGFVERKKELDQLQQLLLSPARNAPVAITTALHGAGGYGKTTLAAALCHAPLVVDAFDDGVLWVSLGQTPNLVDELGRLCQALTGQRHSFIDATEASIKLAETIEHLKCLLVIDDVWDRNHLRPFLKSGPGCARLITSRRMDLVSDAARVLVDEMSVPESVALLETEFPAATVSHDRLEAIARRLGEWPLLLNLAARIARRRLDRGDSPESALTYIEHAFDKHGVTAFDRADAVQRDEAVRRTVAASEDLLEADDSRRLHKLAIFPEETRIPMARSDCGISQPARSTRSQGTSVKSMVPWCCATDECCRGAAIKRLRLWDTATGQSRVLSGHADSVEGALVLPDGRPLSWSNDRTLRVWDLEAGHERVLRGHKERVTDAVLLLDGRPLSWSHDHTLRVWDVTTGKSQVLVGHEASVYGALLLSDGRPLSWSADGDSRAWNLTTGEGRAMKGHAGPAVRALLLDDDRDVVERRPFASRTANQRRKGGRGFRVRRWGHDGAPTRRS